MHMAVRADPTHLPFVQFSTIKENEDETREKKMSMILRNVHEITNHNKNQQTKTKLNTERKKYCIYNTFNSIQLLFSFIFICIFVLVLSLPDCLLWLCVCVWGFCWLKNCVFYSTIFAIHINRSRLTFDARHNFIASGLFNPYSFWDWFFFTSRSFTFCRSDFNKFR